MKKVPLLVCAASSLVAGLLLVPGCGYQVDPTRFQQHSDESAASMEAAAADLRAAAADLRFVVERMETLGSGDLVVSGAGSTGTEGGPQAASRYDLDLPLTTYRWDPDAGDPSVPAELGGPGFTGEGWETNMTFPALGDPDAPQGGRMTTYITDWPATLRQAGKDWNTAFNYRANDLCMMRLVTPHPITLEFIPQLATHWRISDDKLTYWFRINPEARFDDGSEVTAEDVAESWRLRTDPEILHPSTNVTFGKLNEPEVLSKYVLKVTVNEESWRNFLYIAGMSILPAKEIAIGGERYLDEYQFKYTAVAGPYHVTDEDIADDNTSITLRRNRNWWGEGNPAFAGLYNIEQFKFLVVKDLNLAFEKVKAGELDWFIVNKSEWWAKHLPELESVQRGHLARMKVYNDAPIGTAGFALNMSRPPLDDLRVRKALQLLHDRATLMEKLYYGEYELLGSYWQGGTYQNPENEIFHYDPEQAVALLEEAGWGELDGEGFRVKDGRRLQLTLTYRNALSERSLTDYQENCREEGIQIDLQLVTPAAGWKNLQKKEYEMMSTAWGALVFPNPETSWHSRYATLVDNNNVTAFADPRVDELCLEYETAYDVQDRIRIVREMDAIIYNQHPYVLEHFNPAQRVIFWNKFGFPKYGAHRTVDDDELMYCWWVDPEKEAALDAALESGAELVPPEVHNTFWRDWAAAN